MIWDSPYAQIVPILLWEGFRKTLLELNHAFSKSSSEEYEKDLGFPLRPKHSHNSLGRVLDFSKASWRGWEALKTFLKRCWEEFEKVWPFPIPVQLYFWETFGKLLKTIWEFLHRFEKLYKILSFLCTSCPFLYLPYPYHTYVCDTGSAWEKAWWKWSLLNLLKSRSSASSNIVLSPPYVSYKGQHMCTLHQLVCTYIHM